MGVSKLNFDGDSLIYQSSSKSFLCPILYSLENTKGFAGKGDKLLGVKLNIELAWFPGVWLFFLKLESSMVLGGIIATASSCCGV